MPRNLAKKNPKSKPVKPGSGSTQEKKKPEPKPKPTEDEADHKAKGDWTGHEQPVVRQDAPHSDLVLREPPALEPGEERSVPDVAEPSETTVLVEIGGIDKRILGTVVDPNPIEEEPPAPPVHIIERRIETVTVEIPLGEPPTIPPRVHLEVLLRRDHARTWARLRQGLRDKGAKTANGRQVDTKADVMRWLLEQLIRKLKG